jgi:hypothetical protein
MLIISPGKWALGRVLEVHPGSDGLVRVVTLKTKVGILKRPITKLSILPIYHEENQPTQQPNQNLSNNKPEPTHINQDNQKPRLGSKSKRFNLLTMAVMFVMMLITPSQATYQSTELRTNLWGTHFILCTHLFIYHIFMFTINFI